MKKLLIATLLFTGLVAFVPAASAGHRDRDRDYDRDNDCDRGGYRQSYRQDCQPNYRYYQAPPVYYRPAPVVRYRNYDRDDCQPAYRTHRRPALSFVFGF